MVSVHKMANNQRHWLAYSGLGIQMVFTMLFGYWIGQKMEVYFSLYSPIGQLLGLFFGIFASIYNLIKSINK